MIKCLSKGVQAKLRSGIAIFSLQQCVEELVLNGIDAGATCIAVRLDMDAFKVQVIDNGSGMAREDLEHVGKRYFTSKCSTLEDLENLQFHGFRGEAVASIASLSTLVEIASRSRLSSKTFVKIFKDGKGMDVFESEVNRPSVGTTVVICNFFHNMPVRRKRVDVVLECERIRHRVEAISLMHPSISFTLKNDCTGTMVVQLPKAKSIYYRFVQIHGMSRAQKLADICCSYGQFEMSGYIGREGHYNCGLQFLFVNGRLVLKTRIHKLLNFLLKRINVSGRHNGNSGEPLTIGSPRQRAGAEVHGVYIINIKCHYSEYDICLEPAKTLIEFKDWDSVLSCVEKGIREFLTRENLVTELSPEDVCKYVHGNYFIEPIGSTLTVDGNAAKTLCNAEELYDGHKLMSAAVHRILKLDSERTESVQKDYEDNIVNEEPVHRMVVEDFDMTKNVHVDNRYNMVCEEEKRLEIPWDQEQSKENGSLKGAIITNSFGSETDERVINFDSIAGTSTPKPEHLKWIFEGTESHHKVQLENVDGTSFRSSELQHNVSSEPLKGEEQNMYPRECVEEVDYMGQWQSKRHDRKINEWCGEGQVHHTSLEKPGCEANDLMRTALKLGSVGFIRHVVPQQHNAGVLEGSVPGGLSKVLSLGPVSAQDLQPLKECQSRDYCCSTATREPLNHSVNSSKNQYVCRCSLSSVFETKESSILAPKRKLSFLGEPSVIASKALEIKPYQKLALSVQTRSLDRFRRMCVKQTKALCHPLGTADCAEFVDSKESLMDGTSVNAKRPSLDQSEQSETLKVYSSLPSDCCITLSEYTTLKPFVSHSRSSTESIAAKLSQFKQNWVKARSRAPERPLRETSIFFSSLDCATDTLSLDDCNTKKQICPDLCSAGEVTSDMNANNQQSLIEAHCDAFDGRESAQMLAPKNLCDFSDEEANFAKKELSLCCDTTMEQNKQGESIAVGSSDWLEHFDDSIGKLVYINKVTGLSKYEAPAVEETPVPCTTDVTTMSVGVISRNDDVKADTSLSSMFSEWSNPVFARPPEVAVNVTSGQAEGLAVKIHNILYPYRFTKNMIHSMKVVNQVDKKFIACLINTKDVDMECGDPEGNLLVLVDQHAAHERVRLENLIMESYEDDPETPGQRRLCSSSVTPPVEIEVTEEEHRLLRSCQPFLIGLGLELRFAETGDPRLLVGKVPVCFVEREVSELRRGRQSATKAIVEEYIREQIELLQSAGRVRGTLPLTVLKVLASQACHGAVKFNHNLSMEECCSLVGSLSTCQLPFQCAHGRPSMVPLADLLHLDNSQQESPKPNLRKLRQMYRAWELYGKT